MLEAVVNSTLPPVWYGPKELCVLCSFQISAWNYTLGYYGGEQLHVGSNSPPELGCTQGCGFWADNVVVHQYANLLQ